MTKDKKHLFATISKHTLELKRIKIFSKSQIQCNWNCPKHYQRKKLGLDTESL